MIRVFLRRSVLAPWFVAFFLIGSVALAAVELIRSNERAAIKDAENETYILKRRDMDDGDVGEGVAVDDLEWLRGASDRLYGKPN